MERGGRLDLLEDIYNVALEDAAFASLAIKLGAKGFGAVFGLKRRGDAPQKPRAKRRDGQAMDPKTDVHAINLQNDEALRVSVEQEPEAPYLLVSLANQSELDKDDRLNRVFERKSFEKVLIARLSNSPLSFTHLAFFRREQDSDFDKGDKEIALEISKHLSRALQVRALRLSILGRGTICKQLAQMRQVRSGLLTVTREAKLIDIDPIAEGILESGDALRSEAGTLLTGSAKAKESTKKLHDLIANAGQTAKTMRLRNKTGEVYRLCIFETEFKNACDVNCSIFAPVAVLVEPLTTEGSIDVAGFALAFGLTPAETKLLVAMIDAPSSTEATRRLGISRNTTKIQLSNIFRKTGAETQGQLMLMLGAYR